MQQDHFKQETNFTKNGFWIGVFLIVTEYLLLFLFYSYANHDLWIGDIPHKYFFYITFLSAAIILMIVLFRPKLNDEITDNAKNYDQFRINIGSAFGISIFGLGTYIIYYILHAMIFDEHTIIQFVDNNSYVKSASRPFSIINNIAYAFVSTFIYQGFLLNGLSKSMGYQKATIATSVFYGYWSGNMIGGAIFNLFLNHTYKKSKNIFYPVMLSIIPDLTFTIAYIIKPEFWIIKADAPFFNDELVKGLIFTIIGLPVVVPTLIRIFKNK